MAKCGKWGRPAALAGLIALALVMLAAGPAAAKGFTQLNLLSDIPGLALRTDANLVNPWGIAFGRTGLLWVADNGTGVSTVYEPDGRPTGLVVIVPPPAGSMDISAPTGVVFNNTSDFVVSQDTESGPALFLFATEDGTISGWNPSVDLIHAVLVVDNSADEAVYKGIAIANDGQHNFIYVSNFRSALIEVFDSSFDPVGSFTDEDIPAGYAPFGIRNIGGLLYVAYAKQLPPENKDDDPGPGRGFVVVFDPAGNVVSELISRGELNAPWGLAIAPDGFSKFSGRLLVGNFGDGQINAYDPMSGVFVGKMTDRSGHPIVNDGLWGIDFLRRPPGSQRGAGGIPLLYFAAGINDEADGLVGTLRLPPAWGLFGRTGSPGRRTSRLR